ncbi:CCA tRNA nucleotidyltransferase [candidate division WOR-3 bacterium]|nr:CCA tRNA nucleotidyltransferase [candidate division WOR-3 bacterium]
MLVKKLKRKRILLNLSKLVKGKPFDAWLVGGCIRDTFLGIPSKDYDITITGNAHRFSLLLAKKLNGNQFCLDRKMGEFRIMLSRKRTIDVKSIKDISKDIQERDFTINAIALNLKNLKTLYDPVNGIRDLERKIIKPVSKMMFEKDPLRLLRMFRLASTLGFSISKEAMELAKKTVKKIDTVASERVKNELFLLFNSKKSFPSIMKMDRIGLIAALFPEVEKGKLIPQHKYRSRNLKEHSLVCYDIMEKIIDEKRYIVFEGFTSIFENFIKKQCVILKLSALLHDIGKLYTMREDSSGSVHFWMHEKKGEIRLKEYYQHRFSLSNKEVETLSLLILHHMRAHLLSRENEITNHALYRFVKDGKDAIPGILLLSYADSISSSGGGKEVRKAEKTIRTIMNYYVTSRKVKSKKKLITGYDLIEQFGLEPGPAFKTILEAVEKAYIEGIVKNKNQALQFVKKIIVELR